MKLIEMEKDGKKCIAQENQVSIMSKDGWSKTGQVKSSPSEELKNDSLKKKEKFK